MCLTSEVAWYVEIYEPEEVIFSAKRAQRLIVIRKIFFADANLLRTDEKV